MYVCMYVCMCVCMDRYPPAVALLCRAHPVSMYVCRLGSNKCCCPVQLADARVVAEGSGVEWRGVGRWERTWLGPGMRIRKEYGGYERVAGVGAEWKDVSR